MRLKKGKIEGKLRVALDSVYRVSIKQGSNKIELSLYKFPEIYEIINRDPMKLSFPSLIAIRNDRYVIYPIPDKNYYLEIIGTTIVKL